jgi:hypothetical protein
LNNKENFNLRNTIFPVLIIALLLWSLVTLIP